MNESSVIIAAAKASFVGENHVNGPGPDLKDSRPAIVNALLNIDNRGSDFKYASRVGLGEALWFFSQPQKDVTNKKKKEYLISSVFML